MPELAEGEAALKEARIFVRAHLCACPRFELRTRLLASGPALVVLVVLWLLLLPVV